MVTYKCQVQGCNAKEDLYLVELNFGSDSLKPRMCVCGAHERLMFHKLVVDAESGEERVPVQAIKRLVDAEGVPCSK